MPKPMCFVLMPAGNNDEYSGGPEEADSVFFDIIYPAVQQGMGENVEIIREIDRKSAGAITPNIIRCIARADFCVVDITGRNANVFFELGVRYSIKKSGTILMRQAKRTPIPFDISGYRVIDYNPFRRKEAVDELALYLSQGKATDSVVYDVLSTMEVHFNEPSNGEEDVIPSMPWSTYWERLSRIGAKLQEAAVEGQYRPDVLVGITNGGAMFVDLLARKISFEGPIISLWANRSVTSYFDNIINDSICDGIKRYLSQLDPKPPIPRILVVDDNIATGFTYRLAIEFLEKKIQGCEVSFLPLFYRNEPSFKATENIMVWNRTKLNFESGGISEMHRVRWGRFPYEKDIRA